MSLLDHIAFLSPEIVLAVGGMVALLTGLFVADTRKVFVLCAVVVALGMVALFMQPDVTGRYLFEGQLAISLFTQGMKFFLLGVTIMVLAMTSRAVSRHSLGRFEWPVLMLFSTIGMMVMISASSWLTFYLGLELQSLAIYVMVAFARDNVKASEGAAKYFILGALASGFILFGISYIYGATGTLNYFSDIEYQSGYAVGMAFILAGVAFKMSLVPFHMWTPDVYEGAPLPVTSYLALVPKIAILVAVVNMLTGPFLPFKEQSGMILLMVGIASVALGSFGGLAQQNIKRLMAYSTIGNIGTLVLALSVISFGGIMASVNYLFIYIMLSGVIFAALLGIHRNGEPIRQISQLAGLSKDQPILAWALAAAFFGLAGIPPLTGFFAKFEVFRAVIAGGHIVIATLAIAMTVVAAAYYIRIIKVMFFDPALPQPIEHDHCLARRAVLVILSIKIVMMTFMPDLALTYLYLLFPNL